MECRLLGNVGWERWNVGCWEMLVHESGNLADLIDWKYLRVAAGTSGCIQCNQIKRYYDVNMRNKDKHIGNVGNGDR